MIRVILPSQLESYTEGVRELYLDPQTLSPDGEGGVRLAEVITGLERKYRGLAFRIVDEQQRLRRHIALFVGEEQVRDLDTPLGDDACVQIVGALSGG